MEEIKKEAKNWNEEINKLKEIEKNCMQEILNNENIMKNFLQFDEFINKLKSLVSEKMNLEVEKIYSFPKDIYKKSGIAFDRQNFYIYQLIPKFYEATEKMKNADFHLRDKEQKLAALLYTEKQVLLGINEDNNILIQNILFNKLDSNENPSFIDIIKEKVSLNLNKKIEDIYVYTEEDYEKSGINSQRLNFYINDFLPKHTKFLEETNEKEKEVREKKESLVTVKNIEGSIMNDFLNDINLLKSNISFEKFVEKVKEKTSKILNKSKEDTYIFSDSDYAALKFDEARLEFWNNVFLKKQNEIKESFALNREKIQDLKNLELEIMYDLTNLSELDSKDISNLEEFSLIIEEKVINIKNASPDEDFISKDKIYSFNEEDLILLDFYKARANFYEKIFSPIFEEVKKNKELKIKIEEFRKEKEKLESLNTELKNEVIENIKFLNEMLQKNNLKEIIQKNENAIFETTDAFISGVKAFGEQMEIFNTNAIKNSIQISNKVNDVIRDLYKEFNNLYSEANKLHNIWLQESSKKGS